MSDSPPPDWSSVNWEGVRRAQLRAALALTVRERLEAMEALGELSDRIGAATGRATAHVTTASEPGVE